MSARRVQGDGVELAVYEQGDPSGPAVLLVHGYPDTHAVWDEVAGILADRFHVIRYDVRGAGASGRPAGRVRGYAFEHLVADMRAVLDETVPGEPVHLVGHDWGSIQSWEAVCTMPGRFASYTSMSGPCLDHVARWMRHKVRRPTPRNLWRLADQLMRSWYIYFFQTPFVPEALWRAGIGRPFTRALRIVEGVRPRDGHPAATLPRDGAAGVGLYRANMARRLLRPRERTTEVPTLVIVPTKDRYVSPHLVGGLAERVPRLSLRTVDAAHWLPRTRPAQVAEWVAEHAMAARLQRGAADAVEG